MIAQPLAVEVGFGRSVLPGLKSAVVPPSLKRTFRNVTAVIFLGFTMLVLGVVINARKGTTPHPPDLPQRFLPGNPLPSEIVCMALVDEHDPRCLFRLSDDDVHFNFDAETHIIVRTIIPAQKYTVGDLMAAWGTPTGITRNETNVYIYWGIRSALLYTRSLQPDSRVDFILYDRDQPQAAVWRGFTASNR